MDEKTPHVWRHGGNPFLKKMRGVFASRNGIIKKRQSVFKPKQKNYKNPFLGPCNRVQVDFSCSCQYIWSQ